jgi:hypothetical protein
LADDSRGHFCLATQTLTAGGKKTEKEKEKAPLESKIAHENSAA